MCIRVFRFCFLSVFIFFRMFAGVSASAVVIALSDMSRSVRRSLICRRAVVWSALVWPLS